MLVIWTKVVIPDFYLYMSQPKAHWNMATLETKTQTKILELNMRIWPKSTQKQKKQYRQIKVPSFFWYLDY